MSLQLDKYLGTWYELAHYPSWFQRNDNYNTTTVYTRNADGTIKVHNSSITQGRQFDSIGKATYLGGSSLRVDFPMPEVTKLVQSGQFKGMDSNISGPNYVVDKIFTNCKGDYVFAIVTDPKKQSLYILSRTPHPSLVAYNEVMTYVVANFDRDRLVQTPHFS